MNLYPIRGVVKNGSIGQKQELISRIVMLREKHKFEVFEYWLSPYNYRTFYEKGGGENGEKNVVDYTVFGFPIVYFGM